MRQAFVLLVGMWGWTWAQTPDHVLADSARLDSLRRVVKLAQKEQGSDAMPLPPYGPMALRTPYHTLMQFQYYLENDPRRGEFVPAQAAKTLFAPLLRPDEQVDIVLKIKQILVGRGVQLYAESFPRDSNYVDSSRGERYLLSPIVPDIYLEKLAGRWYFSRHSVRQVPRLYAEMYPLYIDRLLHLLPTSTERFLGLNLRQWLSLILYALLAWLLYRLISKGLRLAVSGVVLRLSSQSLARPYILLLVRPVAVLSILLLLLRFWAALELPLDYNVVSRKVLWFLVPVYAIVILYRGVGFASQLVQQYLQRHPGRIERHLVLLLARTARVLVVVVGIFVVLHQLGVDITALIAGLSIGGLALALAAKDTVANLFGSAMIFLDRPFQVGQEIRVGDLEGVVEEVGFRSTRIRTFHNSVVSIPNSQLSDAKVENMDRRDARRYRTELFIPYATPPERIQAYLDALRELANAHPLVLPDRTRVFLWRITDSALAILVIVHINVSEYDREWNVREELNLAFLNLAQALGLHFEHPTQQVVLRQPEPDVPPAISPEAVLARFREYVGQRYPASAPEGNPMELGEDN